MSAAPRWGVSSLDWRSHTIDEDTEHPDGMYVTRCDQRLVMGTSLLLVYDGIVVAMEVEGFAVACPAS